MSKGKKDELLVDQMIRVRVPGLLLHQVLLGLLEGEADGGQHVGPEVDAEDGEDTQGQWNTGNHTEQENI